MTDRICSIEGCDRKPVGHGWCYKHYQQRKRAGDPAIGPKVLKYGCTVEGCAGTHMARGWCEAHYSRWRRWGDPLGERPRVGFLNPFGYRKMGWRHHPLADNQGVVAEHRVVLWDTIGPGAHPCNWCGTQVDWDKKYPADLAGLVVDHLDNNPGNNDPSNLVPSCGRCNLLRGVETRRAKRAAAAS